MSTWCVELVLQHLEQSRFAGVYTFQERYGTSCAVNFPPCYQASSIIASSCDSDVLRAKSAPITRREDVVMPAATLSLHCVTSRRDGRSMLDKKSRYFRTPDG